MTPMVDLACLLLTFFMLTTQFSKPKTMEMSVPKDVKDTAKQTKIDDDLAITILLDKNDKNKVYYYTGKFVLESTQLIETDLSDKGLRKFLATRNKAVIEKLNELRKKVARKEMTPEQYDDAQVKVQIAQKDAPFVILKTTGESTYNMVVDAIDELRIADIGKYALVDVSNAEKIVLFRKMGKPIPPEVLNDGVAPAPPAN
ncbi:MAG: biopolymer transport protein ExbD/TolR [Bacteroidetes bacterium]|nr:MAG: biopolymer transport protein ExbD/TolR [Bacteroidota bacterium]